MIFILLVTGLKTNKTNYQKHLINIEKKQTNIVVLLKTVQNPTRESFIWQAQSFFFKRLFMIFLKAII